MKYVHMLLMVLLMGTACKKEDQPLIEPRTTEPVTITTGEYMGIAIGNSVEEAYTRVQSFYTTHHVPTLWVASPIAGLEEVKDNIGNYTILTLSKSATSTGAIHITFEGDTIQSLWAGDQHTTLWPSDAAGELIVREGDNKAATVSKLEKIIALPAYQPFFEAIGMQSKKLNTPFDPIVAKAVQLSIVIPEADTVADGYKVVMLDIQDHQLKSITYYNFWQQPE
jgi:hypothetical protein